MNPFFVYIELASTPPRNVLRSLNSLMANHGFSQTAAGWSNDESVVMTLPRNVFRGLSGLSALALSQELEKIVRAKLWDTCHVLAVAGDSWGLT